ncbi:uncharacterized protein N7479_001688 [Penicillium vulpinum]|uniref:uncharacterized protein n=1 Tax=Penicillium vulpinum TaxID=29845 RepID=UPI0025468AA4|nr:uncharacterized protein N7479_001688 [Penicillium vulpinum]KAJ5971770.1 hypothetical protein N7479_001688 [Penicillium vulpinum]
MMIITIELTEVPELKRFIDIKNDGLEEEKDPGSKLTTDDVFRYCQRIIDNIRLSGSEGIGAAGGNQNQSRSNQESRSQSSGSSH